MKTLLLEQQTNPQYSAIIKAKNEKSYRIPAHVYVVKQLGDSTTPSIGDVLKKHEVDALCAKKGWKVTIKAKNKK